MRQHKIQASKVTKRDKLLTFSSKSANARAETIKDVRISSDLVTIVTNKGKYNVDPLTRVSIEARNNL